MRDSMPPENRDRLKSPGVSSGPAHRPRVGIPWRTTSEEQARIRQKLDYYFEAVRKAGGEPIEISLQQSPEALAKAIQDLDGFVLPGSPADVDPARYGAAKHSKTNNLDAERERTDGAILQHAFAAGKPVLGICYGCQILNVYLKGTLLQDIPAERPGAVAHGSTDLAAGASKGDLEHGAKLALGSRLAEAARAAQASINSSHHQAIDRPGEGLRVTATAAEDGVVEGVEWTGDRNWVVGVQWHPERMGGDAFSERLFREFVEAARQREVRKEGGIAGEGLR
jgi:putative glutamine amidotransferase